MRLLSLLPFLPSLSREDARQAPIGLSEQPSRPNVVFILTDDQDLHMNSLAYTPLTRKHLLEQGTFFKHHYCTVALCCPSRVSLWTGKAAHNTNVTDVNVPYGGYPKFVAQGLNENYLPVWLQAAGYNTYYTGKLFNTHNIDNYDKPHAAGFTGSDFLIDPYTYQYLNSTFQRNHDPPVRHKGEYSTDVLASKAYGFLDDAVKAEKPFFLVAAPNAPHSNVAWEEDGAIGRAKFTFIAPIPAERHKHLFPNAVIPRTENFNPERVSGVSWMRSLPRQNESNVAYNDHYYRERLRALQAVDEMVEGIVKRLEDYGVLDNTYILYSTDNGFHIGQHRMQPGKECGFEEDINIPFIIRGPGIAKNATSDLVTTHTDLSPTILNLIGEPPRPDFDGLTIPVTQKGIEAASASWHEHVTVEYWGFAAEEGATHKNLYWNNTYKAVRVIGKHYSLYYSVWCSGEHELYDLKRDPYQMHNFLYDFPQPRESESILGHPIEKVVARLDSLLFVLKSCKGERCVKPWKALHSDGNVSTLKDALNQRFDLFYEQEQKRVKFTRCEQGYILDAEGPQFDAEGLVYRDGARWSEWV